MPNTRNLTKLVYQYKAKFALYVKYMGKGDGTSRLGDRLFSIITMALSKKKPESPAQQAN
jgi:hypothetical protein